MDIAQIIERNPDAFESDHIMLSHVYELIKKWKCTCAVETGTYLGDTTLALADMVHDVLTVDVNITYHNKASAKFAGRNNINAFLDDSVRAMPKMLSAFAGTPFILLDAHWWKCPLGGELEAIADYRFKSVLMVHDFKVPNHPELGFDTWPPFGEYNLENLKPYLDKIYGAGRYDYHYNSESAGKMRGAIFVEPK